VKKYFKINANKYDSNSWFYVYGPSSIDNPMDNSVMFVTIHNIDRVKEFFDIIECIIFWPNSVEPLYEISKKNVLVMCSDPHLEYCKFFRDNNINNYPVPNEFEIKSAAFIDHGATIGENTIVFPGAYIAKDVFIGDNCFIGSGVKILGNVNIGNNVYIRENTVIGCDGLTTDRDENGIAVSMPQFGGVVINDNVEIGANTVIARGAIDNTIIEKGCKVDNSCFISHNVRLGQDTFVVGESILFGSSSTGSNVVISGESSIRDGVCIGDNAIVGMGSVVVKNVNENSVVVGNPAKERS